MGEVPIATTLRAALAVALLAGFYLLGFGLIGGLAWLSVRLWLTIPGEVAQGASYLVAAAAVGLAVPTWRLLRAHPEPPLDGLTVSEQQAPELWSQVKAVAEAVGTRPPDEIRLVFDANAAVWEDARLLGLRPGRRYLYLGVPLLQACGAAQVRAVLAHELGHYSSHHTRLGALTYRGMQVIIHTITVVGPRSIAGWIFSGYAAIYALVSLAVMRRMELEADRASVRVAGREATVLALRDTPRVGSAWELFLASYVWWNRNQGYTPAEFLTWFSRTEPDRAGQKHAGHSRWDSHPPMDERIAAIKGMPGTPGAPDPPPNEAPVPDLDAMVAALRTAGFAEHLERVAQEEAERDADRLYQIAARVVGTRRRGLGSVLDLLADGRCTELRRVLVPELTPAELADLIVIAAATTAVAAGQARWRHSWSAPMTLVHDDRPVALRPLVEQACHDPAGVAPLRALLLELGVDEASVLGWAAPGRTSLDVGPVFRTRDGTEPSTRVELLLPDELFLLAYAPSGRRRLNLTDFEAGLAAAALAELRLRARVRLAETGDTTVIVCDTTPTGDRFLDSVLARVAAGAQRPAYQWIQILGPDVTEAIARRLDLLGRYENDTPTHAINRVPYDNERARSGIVHALNTADFDSPDLVLGALLWATELATPVLGRAALVPRFWLGRLAKRDQLAVAVRTVIGLGVPLPQQNSAGG